MAWWVPLAAAGMSVAGDLFGSKSQQKFNAKEAEKNRNWQENMSNTAYQRAASDMEAAGLNRILAVGNPASTPSGATAAMESPKLGSNAANAGIAAASAKQSIEQSKAQENLMKDQANTEKMRQHLVKEQTIQAQTQANLNQSGARYNDAKSTQTELFNPLQKLGNELLEKVTNYGRSSAKELTKAAEKLRTLKEFNDIKYSPLKRHPNIKTQLDTWYKNRSKK